MKLTPRESQVLSFVALHIEIWGYAPVRDHIAAKLGIRSRTFVLRLLKSLEAKGLVKLEPYKVRGIQVIKQELRAA